MRYADVVISTGERALLRDVAMHSDAPNRVRRRALILILACERSNAAKGDDAAAATSLSDHRIAARVGVCADTVRGTLRRFAETGLEAAIYDKPFVRKITPEAEKELLSLVHSAPPPGSSRWTLERLAERLQEMHLVESISDTGVWDILQKRGIRIERNGRLTVISSGSGKESTNLIQERSNQNG